MHTIHCTERRKEKWKSTDAIGVYCTACKTEVSYDSTKNSKGIQRHMERMHKDLLESYEQNESNKSKRKNFHGIDSFFPKKPKTEKVASRVNQEHFNLLVSLWTGVSLRPFSICEDRLLQDMITFETSVSVCHRETRIETI